MQNSLIKALIHGPSLGSQTVITDWDHRLGSCISSPFLWSHTLIPDLVWNVMKHLKSVYTIPVYVIKDKYVTSGCSPFIVHLEGTHPFLALSSALHLRLFEEQWHTKEIVVVAGMYLIQAQPEFRLTENSHENTLKGLIFAGINFRGFRG